MDSCVWMTWKYICVWMILVLYLCGTFLCSERAEREAADKAKKVDEESDDGLVIGKVSFPSKSKLLADKNN